MIDPGPAPQATIVPGDMVEVDTTPYGVPGFNWCYVMRLAPGSLATYPIKVQVPGRGEGQYKASEVRGRKAYGYEAGAQPEWINIRHPHEREP